MPLRREEHAALDQLVGRLRRDFGPRLVKLFLFGSKARADDAPDPDIDVVVVLSGTVGEAERIGVSRVAYGVLEASGLYLQTVLLSEEQFASPRGQVRWLAASVREEGIPL
ncbi:MAG: nucleotidyltransferase domain-containing protein [Candidatus Latescibacterota bacterium]